MSKVSLSLVVLTLALTACASRGVENDESALVDTFDVATDYESAFRRAGEYYRVCYVERAHRYNVEYGVTKGVDYKGTTAEYRLFKSREPAKILERFSVRPAGPKQSVATLTLLNADGWDQSEAAVARQSIQSATPVCREED